MIIYDKQTTPLLGSIHRVSGVVRTGKSVRVRNLRLILQTENNADALDLSLADAIDTIRGMAGSLVIGVPELYAFEVAGRALTCVHGLVAMKRKYVTDYEYRFVIGYSDEVFEILRTEFKMTERRWKQLLDERLAV